MLGSLCVSVIEMLVLPLLIAHLVVGPKTVSLPLPELKAAPVFAEQTKNESKDSLAVGIRDWVRDRIESNGAEVLPATAGQIRPDIEVQITLLSFKQRNRTTDELFDTSKRGGSETTVEVSLTIVQGKDKAFYPRLKGLATGSFFGGTDRGEMNGAPIAKSGAVKIVNMQRVRALSKAVWEAIRPTVERTFGWKSLAAPGGAE